MKNCLLKFQVHNFISKIINISLAIFLIVLLINEKNFSQNSYKKDLKIMSFNIRYGTANDGENSWQFRKENVFDIIKVNNPDLLGLQEALKFQIDEIIKALPEYKMIGVGRDDGKESGEFSCILYKKNRFIIDTTETFWFSETPNIPGSKHWGNNYTRICTWAKFLDKANKKYFYYYNLHLDHESQPSREKSTQLLVNKFLSQKEKLPIILSGDFNCGETNPAIKTILNFGLKDTYRLLNQSTKDEGTFNDFKGDTNGERIDFIFISKDFRAIESKILRNDYNGKYPSDHFPVFARIRFLK
jgi:endonuclease/exonuclease/phosphatase family metal-dependent hydrolase